MNAAHLRRVADWLEALPEVVTVVPEVSETRVLFHITREEDWREQASAIIATGANWVSNPVGTFISVEGTVDDVGEVDLFIPAYESPAVAPTVDAQALIEAAKCPAG
jgi:hypothetical protein